MFARHKDGPFFQLLAFLLYQVKKFLPGTKSKSFGALQTLGSDSDFFFMRKWIWHRNKDSVLQTKASNNNGLFSVCV